MERKYEKEGFGVSYDRFMTYELFKCLDKEFEFKKVLEMPAYGAKAAPSVYSVSLAKLGKNVTITDSDESMMKYWEELGLKSRLNVEPQSDYANTSFKDGSFDLVWNFVTFAYVNDVMGLFKEMHRVTNKYVVLISCNNFQLGYPWHRLLHKLYGFVWNHGDTYYNSPWNVMKSLKNVGFKIIQKGTIDSPPWPDPVGFRDIRLHKKKAEVSNSLNSNVTWEVPFIDYLKTESFPTWMKILRLYDKTFRKGFCKLPMSHLFYIVAEKK